MDILSKLPFIGPKGSVPVDEAGEDEAAAKRERIKFHREHVRNGPRPMKWATNGQAKRARRRALARMTKNARRTQVRNYFETQRLGAVVRSHLQFAGVLPFVNENHVLDLHRQVVSVAWIVQRFGVEIEVDGEKTGEMSFQKEDVRAALEAALKFHGQVVGREVAFPEDYVIPVYAEPVAS